MNIVWSYVRKQWSLSNNIGHYPTKCHDIYMYAQTRFGCLQSVPNWYLYAIQFWYLHFNQNMLQLTKENKKMSSETVMKLKVLSSALLGLNILHYRRQYHFETASDRFSRYLLQHGHLSVVRLYVSKTKDSKVCSWTIWCCQGDFV